MAPISPFIKGYASAAISSLSPSSLAFLQTLPKPELHAHLNGCIPISTLRSLASTYTPDPSSPFLSFTKEEMNAGLEGFENFSLDDLHGFFNPFKIIYALTGTREGLKVATRDVLISFLGKPDSDSESDGEAECAYLELRTTPREGVNMSRTDYVQTVLSEVELYPPTKASLILSLDRRMSTDVLRECVDIAITMKRAGRRVVGVDLCGDPLAGDVDVLKGILNEVKEAGLGLTLHIAETKENPIEESFVLLGFKPDRLGHATFLDDRAREVVLKEKMAIEICLSSNLLCKTVTTLDAHHIRFYLENNHPIAICTDDTLPFRTTLTAEYALLLAAPPLGLGLQREEVERIAKMGWEVRFGK